MKLIECDVIVVGGGLGGLSASHFLRRHGLNVVLLEASDRVGGRTACTRLSSGLTVELGGEWVGRSHSFAIAACRQFGIGLAVHSFLSREKAQDQAPEGPRFRPSYEVNGIPALKGHLRADPKIRMRESHGDGPWREFLSYLMSPEEIERARACHELIFAQPLEQISTDRAIHHVLKGGRNLHEDFRLDGGTERLVEGFLSGLAGSFRLGEPVQAISDDGRGVAARTATAEYRGRHLVCAVPPKQVLAIDWQPGLPPQWAAWLSGISCCDVTKTFFEFERPFWGSDDFSLVTGTVYHHIYHTAGTTSGGPAVLAAYATGAHAAKAAALDDAGSIAALRAALPREHAGFDASRIRIARKHWHPSDWCSGAYSVFGHGEGFARRSAYQTLNRRIHFAGEHLGEMQGLMDGAIETGWRAADLIAAAARAPAGAAAAEVSPA